jgi:hypothetical protein
MTAAASTAFVDTGVIRAATTHLVYQSMATVSSTRTQFNVLGSRAKTSSAVVSNMRYSPGRVGRSLP